MLHQNFFKVGLWHFNILTLVIWVEKVFTFLSKIIFVGYIFIHQKVPSFKKSIFVENSLKRQTMSLEFFHFCFRCIHCFLNKSSDNAIGSKTCNLENVKIAILDLFHNLIFQGRSMTALRLMFGHWG